MSELTKQPLFFLGANGPRGFISQFSASFSAKEGFNTYIIKGGPGTGKSTLMKRVAEHFIKEGLRCHLCPCSSDPASLDAVIFPDIKVVLLDGTAPHVVEPKYPGACDEIVNLGECWNAIELKAHRDEIISTTLENKEWHKKASNYISAAGCVIGDTRELAYSSLNRSKAVNFAHKLAKKHLPKTLGEGREWFRYLSGITPKGSVFWGRTIDRLTEQKVVISDAFGAASSVIMEEIRKEALRLGHEIVVCRCPMNEEKTDHIIIPALSLSFCTNNRFHPIETNDRIIHARRFMNMSKFHKERMRINFNRRAAAEFLSLAAESLASAKESHDRLEALYIKTMDYAKLNAITEKIVKNIENLII